MITTYAVSVLPPTLNEQINTARASKGYSASAKDKWTKTLANIFKKLSPIEIREPVWIETVFYLKNFSRDADNTDAARKYIYDGLVLAGILENDSLRYIKSPSLCWYEPSDVDSFAMYIYTKDSWEERFNLKVPERPLVFH